MSAHTVSHSLDHPTDSTSHLVTEAKVLLDKAWDDIQPVGLSLLGFTAANLSDASSVQLGLDLFGRDPTQVDSTMDEVRDKFGNKALTRGSLVNHRPIEMPLRWPAWIHRLDQRTVT